MKVHLGNCYLSIEEVERALGCGQKQILELALTGAVAVHYDTVLYSRLPRRSRREPFFLQTDIERIAAQNRATAFSSPN